MRVDAYGGNGIGDDRNFDSFKGLAMGNTRNGVKKAYDKSKYGFVIVFVGVFHKALFVCFSFANIRRINDMAKFVLLIEVEWCVLVPCLRWAGVFIGELR